MINDDIYNSIIELKQKMKLWKWAAIAVMSKKYGETNTFMSIMLMTKTTLDMWISGSFHSR